MYGTYTVTISGSGGCSSTASVTIVPCGSVNKNAGEEAPTSSTLTAFPNPFTQSSTITFALPVTTEAVLKVYGIDGREVAQLFKGVVETGQQYTVQFEGIGLASGVYIVSLTGETGEPIRYRIMLSN